MDRKGLSHIDWVISFGVFIVFLLLLFIWFGPLLTTEYSEEYLAGIAAEGFKDASYHEVFKYPIFVEVYGSSFPERRIKLSGMGGSGIIDATKIALFNFDGDLIDHLTISGDDLVFTTHPTSLGIYSYELFVSNYFNNAHLPVGGNPSTIYNVTLGVGERLYGFSEERFNNLSIDYRDFKEELKYPTNKDVSVFVYDSINFTNILYHYNVSEPTENDNVYVISWSDVLINETGGMEQITVLVKTW
jgi:hypothetical protein